MTSSNGVTLQSVVFIDSDVPDIADLLNGLAPGVEAFVIDPSSDGLAQIASILAANDLTDLSSISIVGHGADGEIQVGSTTLDAGDLSDDSAALAQIGAAIAPGGQLQLYSCDTANGAVGQQFVAELSQFVGAPVAASSQDIGQTPNGENWTLDVASGAGSTVAAANAPFTQQAEADFQGTLSSTTFQVSQNTGLIPSIVLLGDGDIAVAFSDASGAFGSDVTIFDQNGNRIDIGGNTDYQGADSLANTPVVQGPTSNTFWMLEETPTTFGGDSNETAILATEFTVSGTTATAGSQISIVPGAGDNPTEVSVAQLSNGDYVVVWQQTDSSFSSGSVDIQIFNSTFTQALSAATPVSAVGGGTTSDQDILVTANGLTANVTWTQGGTNALFGASATVASNGSISSQTSPVDLTSTLPSGVTAWQQTTLANGDILVLYDTAEGSNGFVSGDGDLFGKIFSPGFTGSPTPFDIAPAKAATGGGTWTPNSAEAVVLPGGDYVVVFSQDTSGTSSEIYAVIYNSNNTPLTSIFPVSTSSVNNTNPQVTAANGQGGLAVTWMQGSAQIIEASIYSDIGPISNGAASHVADAFNTAPAGEAVSSLISVGSGDQYDSISGHTFAGVAVVGDAATAAQGVWQYSSNNGGSWTTISTLVSDTDATIIGASDLIRFDPATNFSGTPGSLTVLVWDGQDGFTADTAGNSISSDIFDSSGTTQTTASFTGAFAGNSVAFDTDIIGFNDAPTADLLEGGTVNASTTAAGVLGSLTNTNGDTITVSAVDGTGGDVGKQIAGTYGELTLNANGTYTYLANDTTAINGASGGSPPIDTFDFTVSDQTSGATDQATLSFTIFRPPVLAAGAGFTVQTVTGAGAVFADADLTVSDSNPLGATPVATVSIGSPQTGDELLIPAGDLTGNVVNGTGGTITVSGLDTTTLTLTGTSSTTATEFQDALEDVEFDATSPHSGQRTLTWSFNDDAGGFTNDSNSLQTDVDAAFGPTITTQAEPSNVALSTSGVTLMDSATVTGGTDPTGTITFTLTGPANTTVDTETATANGDGTYSTSKGYALPGTGTVTGTYTWSVSYGGDANNAAATASPEQAIVAAASPTLTTTASPGVTLSANGPVTLSDAATITGLVNAVATDTVTFDLYSSATTQNSSTLLFSNTQTVSLSGSTATATSASYTATAVGTDYWVATFNGDANNSTVSSGATAEPVTVAPAAPSITTSQQPASAIVGDLINDAATVTGLVDANSEDSVTFDLYSSATVQNSTTLLDSVTEALSLSGSTGTATSAFYTAAAPGTDYWVATFNGDSNNTAVTSGSAAEPVTVSAATPTLSTTPNGTTITLTASTLILSDTAELAGGYNETGSITFTLFYDGGSNAVDTETVTVNGNGSYTTPHGYTVPTSGTVAGTYQWGASYSGDTNNTPVSDTGNADEQTTVSKDNFISLDTTPSPTMVTLGSGTVTLTDTAVLFGGYNETGTITFTLFQGTTLVHTETMSVNGDGSYTTPIGYTLPTSGTITGIYQWDATYSGDGNNDPVSDTNELAEQVMVSAATPSISTSQQPPSAVVGTAVSDTATVTGLVDASASDTVTFNLYSSATVQNSSTLLDSITETLLLSGGTGTATGSYTPTATGTDYWVATFNGDTNNNSVSSGATAEPVTVTPTMPSIGTGQQPASAIVGTAVSDTATVTGLVDASALDTVTFNLYSSATVQNSSTLLDSDTEALSLSGGTGTATSASYTPTATGTDYWVATFNGDTNNNSVTSGATAEPVTVTPANPTLTTTAGVGLNQSTGAVTLGDTAILSGGFDPTGSITFTLTNPGGTTVDTETVAVSGNGAYSTPTGDTFASGAAAAGLYSWSVTYSGDPNNSSETATPEQTAPTPVVTAASSNVNANASETFAASQLFTASSSLPILTYEVEDESTNSDNGFWVLNGAVLPNGQLTTLTAAQLSELSFVAGSASVPVTDTLEVAASDTAGLGAFTTFEVVASAHVTTAPPTVTAANELQAPNISLAASSLFSATAFNGGAIASYQVEDTTPDSGNWVFNGTVEPTNQIVDVTAAQLSELSFDTGYGSDTLKVRANDGSQWGSFTTFTVTPPPNAAPPAGTEDTLVMLRNADGAYEFYDIGHNTILLDGPLGQINPALQVAGVGGFDGGDTADLLMRDPTTGAFTIYDVSNNNITGNVALGQVGPEWTVSGVGDFSTRPGETDMLMRNANTGAFEVYDISNNAITFDTGMGQVGLEWTVSGFGDFSGRANETDMLMRNSNTGAFEVYDIVNNAITSAGPMGQVGLEWTIAGFGDFSGRADETDMLMRNANTGAFEVYDIVDNAIASAQSMGQVGLEWTIAGFGDFSGNPNETDMLMRNSNNGDFELYDISNNAITQATGMGQVGLEWSIGGVSASVAGAPPSSATTQLSQAMASFAPSGGTVATSSPLEPTTPAPSAAANLLTTPNPG